MSTAHATARFPDHVTPVAFGAAMREVIAAADDVAPTQTTVLLRGESGTGKDVLARYVHERSGRAGPCVTVRCSDPAASFPGAAGARAATVPQAGQGTLLLDEAADLSSAAQAELLRALDGDLPFRVIAMSSRDLGALARQGRFRTDLLYRLDVFPIVLPPLRDRPEDLEALAGALVEDCALGLGRPVPALDACALAALRAYGFPGNVRELRNVLSRGIVRCRGAAIGAQHLRLPVAPGAVEGSATAPGLPLHLGVLERLAIAEALRRVGGNRTHAARLLGIGLRTLRNKLRAYREAGIDVEPAGVAAGQLWPTLARFAPARASQEERS